MAFRGAPARFLEAGAMLGVGRLLLAGSWQPFPFGACLGELLDGVVSPEGLDTFAELQHRCAACVPALLLGASRRLLLLELIDGALRVSHQNTEPADRILI